MRASLVLTIVVMVAVCCVHARPNRYEQVSKRTQKETNLLEELRELLNTSPKKSTDKSEHSVARKQLSHMSKKSASKRQYAYGYGCSVANCKHCDYYYRVCAMCRYGYVLRDGVCEGGAGNVEQGQYTTASPDENPNSPDPYDYTDRSEQTTASSYDYWNMNDETTAPPYDSWNRNEDTTTHPYENDVTSQDDSSSYVYGCARMAELYGPRGEIDITASQYKNNMRCHWRITVNVGERVHLHFKNFDVENATRDECTFDSVKVYDGKSMKSPLLNTFCGSDVPGEMTSTGNTLLISFLTDSSETRDGFSVEYRERDRGAPQCGFPDKFPVYPGIKGGSAAQPHSWPWQASLQYRDIHFCGATIISKRWLITSQHCLVSRSLSGITVVVGDHCRGQQEYNRRIHDADGFYNRSANVGIGLIRLKEPIEFNRDVSQLCLPKKTAKVRTMCMTTGWGTRRDNSSMCLNQVSLKLTEGYNCDRMSGDEAYLCADYNYEGKNECQGDEGGPLVCKSEEMGVWNLQGIHIRQKDNCAGKKTHTLFQEITSSLEWIERTVSDNGGW